jgi:hypothetical protein
MYTQCWQIIRDDSKKTFEVCGQEENLNHFTNLIHGMQKAGLSVTCLTPPVSNKNSNKASIKISGYTPEKGLYDRLMKAYRAITIQGIEDWE